MFPAFTSVSPSKGVLLAIYKSFKRTSALGKLRNKLISASLKSNVALMLLLAVFLTSSMIFPSKIIGKIKSKAIKISRIIPKILANFFIQLFRLN